MVRLSKLFLGPGDNFLEKLRRKQICHTKLLVNWDLLATHHPRAIDDFKNYMDDDWFRFRHKFFKNYFQNLKTKDAQHDSLQSALKIRL